MNLKSAADVLKVVKVQNVSFIQLWFTDVLGMLKSFSIRPSELEEGMTEGMGFDGSSIEGFSRIEESDMLAMPDPTTFQLIPWRPDEAPVARMFCDILQPDGSPARRGSDVLFSGHQRELAARGDLRGPNPSRGKARGPSVERPSTVNLTINLKAAKGLGLTIPQSVLLRANQVIE